MTEGASESEPAPLQPSSDTSSTDSFDRLLRHAFADASVDARPARPGPAGSRDPGPQILSGRYQLGGEIGRGGVGVVYRATDMALNREVAVKLLDACHTLRAGLTQRFLEEAQVAAQLEHPGIVPIHDVGLAPDGRPFFVMKLLAGRPLSRLLGEARIEESMRFDIFEQVCRAVARAHDAGVVHRDLKPSNIVVGTRGEAQVVDWGLAKVLGEETAEPPRVDGEPRRPVETVRSSSSAVSITGSVFGTPGYMAPEQAEGRIESIGPQTDVFALGAILAELLTDRPIYEGPRDALLDQARRAAVAPALARVAASCDEPRLVDLVRDALRADPTTRPASAGVLAERVATLRRNAAERVREAELRALASEARADAECRARRWQLGALSAASVLVLLGGAVVWAIQVARNGEIERTAREVDEALAALPVLGHLDPTVESALVNEGTWRAVEGALARARSAARAGRADAEIRARIETAERRVAKSLDAWRAFAVARQADAEFVARAVAIAAGWMDGWDHRAADERFRELFATRFSSPPTAAEIDRAIASPIRRELLRSLDVWWFVRRNAVPGDEPAGQGIGALASALDPDPDRAALREVIVSGRPIDDIEALFEPWRHRDLDAATAMLVARSLTRADRNDQAREVLQRAFCTTPDDFVLSLMLHWAASGAGDPDDALRFATAAVAIEPDSVVGWHQMGALLHEDGRTEEAARAFERVIALDESNAWGWEGLARTYHALGRFSEAAVAFRRVMELDPDRWECVAALVDALDRAKRGAEARRALEAAFERWPVRARVRSAWRERAGGRPDRARALCEAALAAAGSDDREDWLLSEIHFVSGLAATDLADRAGAIASYRQALEYTPTAYTALYNLGLLLGDEPATRAQAVEVLRLAAREHPQRPEARRDLIRLLEPDGDVSLEERFDLAREIATLPGEVFPDDVARALAWQDVAAFADRLGRGQARLEAAIQAARLRPDDWMAQARVAQGHYKNGDLHLAEAAWRDIAKRNPEHADVQCEIARIRHALGRFREGEAAGLRSLELVPDHVLGHYWLARCLEGQHRPAEALPHLERARDLGLDTEGWDIPVSERVERCRKAIR